MMTAVETKVEIPTLNFSAGLPGFPEANTFVLVNTDLAQEPFSIMRCVEDETLEFVVTTPAIFFPDYAPEIDDATVGRVGLESPEDALLLVVLTVGEDVTEITANLLGPIVINKKTHAAAQAVLINQDFDLRQPLFSEEVRNAAKEE